MSRRRPRWYVVQTVTHVELTLDVIDGYKVPEWGLVSRAVQSYSPQAARRAFLGALKGDEAWACQGTGLVVSRLRGARTRSFWSPDQRVPMPRGRASRSSPA